MKLFDPHLLNLFPFHRGKEKRTQSLTLDELIDDYRRTHEMSASEFDFLMMSYRYEHIFKAFLDTFSKAALKPPELLDLFRLAFAALLTRDDENIAPLTHALVETAKHLFGAHTASITNAFCRRALRAKPAILAELQKNPSQILGAPLNHRWQGVPELRARFAAKIAQRPTSGIWALDPAGNFAQVTMKQLVADRSLAMSEGSYSFVKWMAEQTIANRPVAPIKLLDMCAAPGGKLIALTQLLKAAGVTVAHALAVDAKFKRIERLKENLATWNLADVHTRLLDWTREGLPADAGRDWDLVLADLPCSALGTLAARPDILLENWAESDQELFTLQRKILEQALAIRRATPGASLFVAICSSDPSEIKHIDAILGAAPAFRAQLSESNAEEITAWRV